MKTKRNLIFLAVAFVALIGAAGFAYGRLAEKADYEAGLVPETEETAPAEDAQDIPEIEAPDFTATDLKSQLTGKAPDAE